MRQDELKKNIKIAVVGLGYVGVPIAVEFAKHLPTIGFDTNEEKIQQYKKGVDPTNEIAPGDLEKTTLKFVSDKKELKNANFFIVAVPTPINKDKTPNLDAVRSATEIVGRNLSKGDYVVYESTVYPGVTEDFCVPILEAVSGLRCGEDFKVGYSPERINPGDKKNRLANIIKVVSGMDEQSLDVIASVYELIIEAGVFRAANIKVAEAVKLVENAQRDINIAFMNEVAMFFDVMGIESSDVIKGMNTKWNALRFVPGLVGGHCIGVDPYYFIYQSENFGFDSHLLLTGRKINDSMGTYVADKVVTALIQGGKRVKGAKVYIFGITFKENCGDVRNSKVEDVIEKLETYGVDIKVVEPYDNEPEVQQICKGRLVNQEDVKDADCVVFAVAHDAFKDLKYEDIDMMLSKNDGEQSAVVDIKRMFDKKSIEDMGYIYWGL